MITDEARRKVAQKLREPKESLLAYPADELIRLRHETGCPRGQDFYVYLADLIDRPICTIVHSWQEITPGLDELDLSDMCGFELSCGHEVQGYEKPKYCSECGAVVVDED